MKDRLLAISPLDGRYREKVERLSEFFSENALFRGRVEVECRYLEKLSDKNIIRKFSAKEKKALQTLYQNFSTKDCEEIKKIEKTTKHDVKATEYWIKQKLRKTSLKDVIEFVHFGLTSTDTDNIAYAILTDRALKQIVVPTLRETIEIIISLSESEKNTSMLARTHGQPAVSTTLGKEYSVFAVRLCEQYKQLKSFRSKAKLNGAVGNFNAHSFSLPEIDWISFSREFISDLGIEPNLFTTQIEPHDRLVELLDLLSRINSIIIDLDRDSWMYISNEILVLKTVKSEVGSSTMPQKINPIDFENSEGNAKVANSLMEGIGRELQVSRLQRDLSDSTVMRNLGVMFGHSLLAYISSTQGLRKVSANRTKIKQELDDHYEILSEGYQTLLRLKGKNKPYEQLKELVRGKKVLKSDMKAFAESLKIDSSTKKRLAELTTEKYIGNAVKLTEMAIENCKKELRN
ncbi:MAG TPA: adenylosuccinate lyase [Candidatus Nanoarchaeia archaeon]|nr:adenylosuccinate lyase [Candidatus Nanoarchaeia archaeon]